MCTHKFIGFLVFLRNVEFPLLTFSFRHLSKTLRKHVVIVIVTRTNPLQNNLWAIFDPQLQNDNLTQESHCTMLVSSIHMLSNAFVHNNLVPLLTYKNQYYGRVVLNFGRKSRRSRLTKRMRPGGQTTTEELSARAPAPTNQPLPVASSHWSHVKLTPSTSTRALPSNQPVPVATLM